ncbi:MAG: radical SAM protein [Bdellovibrionales bacterium]
METLNIDPTPSKTKELPPGVKKMKDLIEKGKRGELRLSFPVLQINITNKCNLNCVWCWYREDETFSEGHLSLEDFNRFLDVNLTEDANKYDVVNLTSGGEIFMNRKIYEIMSNVKEKAPGKLIWIATNATFTPINEKNKKCYQMVDIMNISIDGATKETFEYIRTPAKFEKVIKNISDLVEVCKETSIELAMTVSQINVREVNELIELAAELKVPSVWVGPAVITNKNLLEKLGGQNIHEMPHEEIDQIFATAKKTAEEKNVRFNHTDLEILKEKDAPKGKYCNCLYPWKTGPFAYDTYIIPCCLMVQEKDMRDKLKARYDFGDPKEKSAMDIYNSEAYWQFREDLLNGDADDFCGKCIYYRFSEDVELDKDLRVEKGSID